MSLASIYQTLKAQGGTIALNDQSLETTGFDSFLSALGLTAPLSVTLSTPLADPTTSLTFAGSSGFLGGTNGLMDADSMNVSGTITVPDSGTALELSVDLPDGWTLGQSFNAFTGGPYSADIIKSPGIKLTYNLGGNDLVLSATISATGPLEDLTLLIDIPDDFSASGPLRLTDNGPTLDMVSVVIPDVKGAFGTITLHNGQYSLSLTYETSDFPGNTSALPVVASSFVATSDVISGHPIQMQALLTPTSSTTLIFTGDPSATGNQIDSQQALAPLFSSGAAFPGALTTTGAFDGLSPGLKTIGVTGSIHDFSVSNIFGTIGLTHPWTPFPTALPALKVNQLDLDWDYVTGSVGNHLFTGVKGELALGDYIFDLSVDVSGKSFAGQWRGAATLSLTEINSNMLTIFPATIPANSDINTVTFGGFAIGADIDAQTVSVSAVANANVQLGSLDLELTAGYLEVDYNWKTSDWAFLAKGLVSIDADWIFQLSGTISSDGFQLTGNLFKPQEVTAEQIVNKLLGGNVVTPSQFSLSAEIKTFTFAIDTEANNLEVSGEVDWALTVLGKELDGALAVQVQSHGAPRSWNGVITGGIHVSDMVFAVSYTWNNQHNILSGYWSSGSSYDWTSIIGQFGQNQPSLPVPLPQDKAPNLKPNAQLLVSYDFTDEIFTIQGDVHNSTADLKGFLILTPNGSTKVDGSSLPGFAAGLQFSFTPGFFGSLSSSLAMFDDYGISGTLALVIADYTNNSFILPISGQAAFPGIHSGFSFYGTLNWQSCGNSLTKQAIAALSSSEQPSEIDILIGFYDITGGWEFKFAGAITNIGLDLGENVTLDKVMLAMTAIETTTFDFQVLFDIGVLIDPKSGHVSGGGNHPDKLYFDGQIGFEQSEEGTGAFAAIFMSGTWYEPFDIANLSVADLGLLLGIAAVAEEVPVPSFGLTGFLAFNPKPDVQFNAFVAIYFDGAAPDHSLFIGSMHDVSFMQFAEMIAWAAGGVTIPSLLQKTLNEYGIHPIPFDLSDVTVKLTAADFSELNDHQIPANFFALAQAVGQPIEHPPKPHKNSSTLSVILGNEQQPSQNTVWYVADFQTGRIFVLTQTAADPLAYTLEMQPWLYVVPNTVPVGPTTYNQGFGFGGELQLPGLKLDILAQLATDKGLLVDADAPEPIVYPAPIGGVHVPVLLTISSATDTSKGPSLSLATYQQGDVPPHFYLDAQIALLNLATVKAQVKILSSGLSFALSLDAIIAKANLDCLVGSDGFAASTSFSLGLNVHTNAYQIGGVTVIPEIDLDTSFGFSLAVSFPLSANSSIPAQISGQVFFTWFDQSFSASISFTLTDLNDLVSSLEHWLINNIGEILKDLIDDAAQWARALANGLYNLTAEAAAAALKALNALADEAASLLAETGLYEIVEIYNAIKSIFSMTEDEAIRAITKALQISNDYVAIGQQIGPNNGTISGDIKELMGWLQNTANTDFNNGNWTELEQSGAGLTVVLQSDIANYITLYVAMSDPDLYQMRFKGLGLDTLLNYQYVSTNLGKFSGTIPSSEIIYDMGFGPFKYRRATVDITIDTNGHYTIDYGYPDNDDWSRTAGITTPLFTAEGGYRLQSLDPGTNVPSDWGPVTIASQFDSVMRFSLGSSLDIGILSGGWWLDYSNSVDAVAGYGDGIQSDGSPGIDPKQPTYMKGIVKFTAGGGIYGSVDFGIVSASVHITVDVTIADSFNKGSHFNFTVTRDVRVGAKIRINCGLFKITISFHFHVKATIGPSIMPWEDAPYIQKSSLFDEPVQPIPFGLYRDPAFVLASAMAAPTDPLTLLFAPELTIAYDGSGQGTPQIVLNLAAPYAEGQADCDFNLLVRNLLQWSMSLGDISSAGLPLVRKHLERLQQCLNSKARLSRRYDDSPEQDSVLSYPALVSFLKTYFTKVEVTAPTADGSAVFFPMIPDMKAAATPSGGKPIDLTDFSSYNMEPASYEDAIEQVFALFKLFSTGQNPVPLADEDGTSLSLATYVFVAYFEYLLKGGTSEALELTGAQSLKDITAAQWAALCFDQTASGLTTSFRGGIQLPTEATQLSTREPIFVLTGQQLPISHIAAVPAAFSVNLAAGAAGGWITLGTADVDFSSDQLKPLENLAVTAPLTLAAPAPLTRTDAVYTAAVFSAYTSAADTAGSFVPLPAGMTAAAPLTATLSSGTPTEPKPFTAQWQVGSRLDMTIGQIRSANGDVVKGVFELSQVNPDQMTKVEALLDYIAQGKAVELSLLIPSAGGLKATTVSASDITLLRTNLSTESRPPSLGETVADQGPVTAATLSQAQPALEIFAAFGQTNLPGYYLSFASNDPNIDALFNTASTARIILWAARGALSASTDLSVMSSDDGMVVSTVIDSLFATASDAYVYQSAAAPGVLPIKVSRPNPAPSGDDDPTPQQWIDQLYNLFTVSVAGSDGYADIGYAPAVSPTVDPTDSSQWDYTLALPLPNLMADGPDANPYSAIGSSPEVSVQLRDCFGNPLGSNIASFSRKQAYTDPLIGPSSWIGTVISWAPGQQSGTLSVTVSADKTVLDNNTTSAVSIYQQAAWQLSRPQDIQFSVLGSIDSAATGMVLPDATKTAIIDYVSSVLAYLGDQTKPLPQPISITYAISTPVSAMPPVQVGVTFKLARTANVDADAAGKLKAIAAVSMPVAADLQNAIAAFAKGFESAFPSLLMATGADSYNSHDLWAVAKSLLTPAIAGKPDYFAPAPLYTSLQDGSVTVPQYGDFSTGSGWPTQALSYSDIDCDELLKTVFGQIDGLLNGPFASAAFRANAQAYQQLVEGRSAIAKAYSSQQLSWLFEQQAPTENPLAQDTSQTELWGARTVFSNRLQSSLQTAYAIDGVLALGTSWSDLPAGWSGAGISLWGTVQPNGVTSPLQPSTAKIKLTGTDSNPDAVLYYVAQCDNVAADAAPSQPLSYTISNVGLNDIEGQTPTWLSLVTPVVISIADGQTIAVPLVNRFFPDAPDMKQQQAVPGVPAATSFSDLFKWQYQASITVQPVSQDTTTITFESNLGNASLRGMMLDDNTLTLAQSLNRFAAGYAQIAPVLGDVLSGQTGAGNIVAALADLVLAIQNNSTWNPAATDALAQAGAGTVYTLQATLAASQQDPKTWLVTIKSVGSALPGTLTVVPQTVSGDPQPDVTIVSTDPLVISYQPVDPAAPVTLALTLDALDLRVLQNIRGKAQVVRNADLLPDFTTEDRYIMKTATVAFPQPVAPSNAGPAAGFDIANIVTQPSSATLDNWLASLLEATVGTAGSPRLAAMLGYRFPQFTTTTPAPQASYVEQPISMSRTIAVDNGAGGDASPTAAGQALAATYDSWSATRILRQADGQIVINLTYYAAPDAPGPALLSIPNLSLDLSKIS